MTHQATAEELELVLVESAPPVLTDHQKLMAAYARLNFKLDALFAKVRMRRHGRRDH